MSSWRRASHKTRKEQKKKVCLIPAPPVISLNVVASDPGNGVQMTRTSLSRVLNPGKVLCPPTLDLSNVQPQPGS